MRWEARRFGFDRFPRVGDAPWQRQHEATYQRSGVAQVHALLWHLDKHRLWEAAAQATQQLGEPGPTPTFTTLASFGTPLPHLDLRVADTGESWDPREETFDDARRRIVATTGRPESEIQDGLIRIVDAGGYRLPDSRSVVGGINRLDRAATWTFLRLRHRWTYGKIVGRWNARHPGDVQLRALDDEARQWMADHPDEADEPFDAERATAQVRKAIREFAANANVDIATSAGRPRQ